MLQISTWCLTSTIIHFLVKHSGDPSCTEFCHQQMFARDRLNRTSACAHSVGYQLHTDSTILQYRIYNSMTVFFADSFRWTSRLGLIFKASSASTKLSCRVLDCGIWWHIFTVNNSYLVVYLLWLNVLQCQKFCNCTMVDFIKISHNVQPAFFQYIKSRRVNKQTTWNF